LVAKKLNLTIPSAGKTASTPARPTGTPAAGKKQ
jgi:hypothetical protein